MNHGAFHAPPLPVGSDLKPTYVVLDPERVRQIVNVTPEARAHRTYRTTDTLAVRAVSIDIRQKQLRSSQKTYPDRPRDGIRIIPREFPSYGADRSALPPTFAESEIHPKHEPFVMPIDGSLVHIRFRHDSILFRWQRSKDQFPAPLCFFVGFADIPVTLLVPIRMPLTTFTPWRWHDDGFRRVE